MSHNPGKASQLGSLGHRGGMACIMQMASGAGCEVSFPPNFGRRMGQVPIEPLKSSTETGPTYPSPSRTGPLGPSLVESTSRRGHAQSAGRKTHRGDLSEVLEETGRMSRGGLKVVF